MQELISKKYIFVDKDYESQDQVFEDLGSVLINDGYATVEYIEALKEREKKFPTGLPTNYIKIAIPHTEPRFVNKPCILVAKLAKPVTFNEMGKFDSPIDIDMIIMLALNDGKTHLNTLQKVMDIISDQEILGRLKTDNTCDGIYETFQVALNK
ncbi:PTS sugar transporter subunit IIA [Enterococcus alishanensis]